MTMKHKPFEKLVPEWQHKQEEDPRPPEKRSLSERPTLPAPKKESVASLEVIALIRSRQRMESLNVILRKNSLEGLMRLRLLVDLDLSTSIMKMPLLFIRIRIVLL